MIKCKHINPYKFKLRANKSYYITAAGTYTTPHYVKVPFSMPEFSSRKHLMHIFHVDIARFDKGVGYDSIIGCDLMVQLCLKTDFERKLMECKETVVPIKDPVNILGQTDLTKCEILELVIQTAEPDSTREDIETVKT